MRQLQQHAGRGKPPAHEEEKRAGTSALAPGLSMMMSCLAAYLLCDGPVVLVLGHRRLQGPRHEDGLVEEPWTRHGI